LAGGDGIRVEGCSPVAIPCCQARCKLESSLHRTGEPPSEPPCGLEEHEESPWTNPWLAEAASLVVAPSPPRLIIEGWIVNNAHPRPVFLVCSRHVNASDLEGSQSAMQCVAVHLQGVFRTF